MASILRPRAVHCASAAFTCNRSAARLSALPLRKSQSPNVAAPRPHGPVTGKISRGLSCKASVEAVSAAESARCRCSPLRLACFLTPIPACPQAAPVSKEGEVLAALSRIIDPDFGMNIVDCGFIKDLAVDGDAGSVSFRLELTTPACPIKDDFEKAVRTTRCTLSRRVLPGGRMQHRALGVGTLAVLPALLATPTAALPPLLPRTPARPGST